MRYRKLGGGFKSCSRTSIQRVSTVTGANPFQFQGFVQRCVSEIPSIIVALTSVSRIHIQFISLQFKCPLIAYPSRHEIDSLNPAQFARLWYVIAATPAFAFTQSDNRTKTTIFLKNRIQTSRKSQLGVVSPNRRNLSSYQNWQLFPVDRSQNDFQIAL